MSEFQSSEDRIQYLSQKLIPATLESLSTKHRNLTQVVQYLEGNYLSATTDKHVIEQEANTYLITALASVSSDIESAATNLDQLLALNSNAVDSLSNQVNLLHTRLRISKDTVAKQNLLDAKAGMKPEIGIAAKTILEEIEPEENISYTKGSIAKRLAALDDVGVCMNKSSSYRPQATSSFGTDRGSIVTSSIVGGIGSHQSIHFDGIDGSNAGSVAGGEARAGTGAVGRTANTGKAGTARKSLLGAAPLGDISPDKAGRVVKPPSLL